jgi:hypothetical protein
LGTKTTFHSAIKRKTSSKLNLSAFIWAEQSMNWAALRTGRGSESSGYQCKHPALTGRMWKQDTEMIWLVTASHLPYLGMVGGKSWVRGQLGVSGWLSLILFFCFCRTLLDL